MMKQLMNSCFIYYEASSEIVSIIIYFSHIYNNKAENKA